jgi:hypothetical protein
VGKGMSSKKSPPGVFVFLTIAFMVSIATSVLLSKPLRILLVHLFVADLTPDVLKFNQRTTVFLLLGSYFFIHLCTIFFRKNGVRSNSSDSEYAPHNGQTQSSDTASYQSSSHSGIFLL